MKLTISNCIQLWNLENRPLGGLDSVKTMQLIRNYTIGHERFGILADLCNIMISLEKKSALSTNITHWLSVCLFYMQIISMHKFTSGICHHMDRRNITPGVLY